MRYIIILSLLVFICSPAYGQLVLLDVSNFTQNNKMKISYKYVDTLSFSINNGFQDTLAYNARIIEVRDNPIKRGMVKASSIESVYNGIIRPSVYMDASIKPYIDRWLERQKKAKEEKETKDNK